MKLVAAAAIIVTGSLMPFLVRSASAQATAAIPPVIAPPETLYERFRANDRDVARAFYKKYIDVKGLPVIASAEVADEALQRTYYIDGILTDGYSGTGDAPNSFGGTGAKEETDYQTNAIPATARPPPHTKIPPYDQAANFRTFLLFEIVSVREPR